MYTQHTDNSYSDSTSNTKSRVKLVSSEFIQTAKTRREYIKEGLDE
jgi:hypothetical protein